MLMCFTTYVYAQGPPVLASENGTVSVLNCSGLIVTNTDIPNPSLVSLIEWWRVGDSNAEHVGGTTYTPQHLGHYYVKFPWHPDPSNTIESVVYMTPTISQFPTGNITNTINGPSAPYVPGRLTVSQQSGVNYTEPLWTKNGDIFESAYDIDELWRPGNYTLTVEGPCGTEIVSHSVNDECDNDILEIDEGYDRTYEFGGTITANLSTDAILGGTMYIQGNVTIYAHMKMEQDAIIIVTPGSELTFDGAIFTSCGTWKGIVVDNAELVFTAPAVAEPIRIYDAEVAITVLSSTTPFVVDKAHFEDNGVHIASTYSNYAIEDNTFSSLKPIPNNNPYASFLSNRETANPMIYAENSDLSSLYNCTFDQRDDNSSGSPNTTTAIELQNTGVIGHGYLDIFDNFEYGIYAKNCEGIFVEDLHFGTPYIEPTIRYDYQEPFSNNGLYFKDCKGIFVGQVSLQPSNNGIEWYLNEDLTPQTAASHFEQITINHVGTASDKTGIIIAPDANPLTNTNPALNTTLTPMKLDILCSRISDCDYGIVGSGKKTDWVYLHNDQVSLLDPSLEFNNISDWEIIWSENPAWMNPIRMTYYNFAPYTDPIVLNGPSIVLDGSSVDRTTTAFATTTLADDVRCAPIWISYKKDVLNTESVEQKSDINLYPNPFTNQVTIALEDGTLNELSIYNSMGSLVLFEQLEANTYTINTFSWASGLYTAHLSTKKGASILKLIKTQ